MSQPHVTEAPGIIVHWEGSLRNSQTFSRRFGKAQDEVGSSAYGTDGNFADLVVAIRINALHLLINLNRLGECLFTLGVGLVDFLPRRQQKNPAVVAELLACEFNRPDAGILNDSGVAKSVGNSAIAEGWNTTRVKREKGVDRPREH